jgi:hypothetical protein
MTTRYDACSFALSGNSADTNRIRFVAGQRITTDHDLPSAVDASRARKLFVLGLIPGRGEEAFSLALELAADARLSGSSAVDAAANDMMNHYERCLPVNRDERMIQLARALPGDATVPGEGEEGGPAVEVGSEETGDGCGDVPGQAAYGRGNLPDGRHLPADAVCVCAGGGSAGGLMGGRGDRMGFASPWLPNRRRLAVEGTMNRPNPAPRHRREERAVVDPTTRNVRSARTRSDRGAVSPHHPSPPDGCR